MPDIGSTLREARMHARIDISEIEAETKIRAKYLRALENEEWDLLPGPTYVKTFLRTYAEALGLDAKLLVEEYKLRHERPSEAELRPIRPASAATRRRGPAGPVVPRWVVVAGVVAVLLGALGLLGTLGSDGDKGPDRAAPAPSPTTSTTSRSSKSAPVSRRSASRSAGAKRARLTLVAKGQVFVCLRASGNRTLMNGETLTAGQTRGPFRASSFRLTLGNNAVRVRVNGKDVDVPTSSSAIGLRITRKGASSLPASQRPTCA
jgi:cytoskeletal protein RodZ